MTFDLTRGSEPEVEKIVDEVEGKRETEANKDEVELEGGVLSEDRFRRGGLDLLSSVAYPLTYCNRLMYVCLSL